VDKIATDLLDFVRETELTDYVIVGHSYGALIALRMALIAQQDISHLVLVSPYLGMTFKPFSLISNSLSPSVKKIANILNYGKHEDPPTNSQTAL
jgi:pimeloyl-ACP methyl ester carboxylesterase